MENNQHITIPMVSHISAHLVSKDILDYIIKYACVVNSLGRQR